MSLLSSIVRVSGVALANVALIFLAFTSARANVSGPQEEGVAQHVPSASQRGDSDEFNSVSQLGTNIHTVLTGGCWSQDGADGFYRLVAYQGGFEDLYQHLYVQIVKIDWEHHEFRTMKTVPIKETEGFALAFRNLQLTSRRATCGDAIFEGQAARRTLKGDVRERVRLRVRPTGAYSIVFSRDSHSSK